MSPEPHERAGTDPERAEVLAQLRENQDKRIERCHSLEDDGLPEYGHDAEHDLIHAIEIGESLCDALLRAEAALKRAEAFRLALEQIVDLSDNATEFFNDLGMADVARAALFNVHVAEDAQK